MYNFICMEVTAEYHIFEHPLSGTPSPPYIGYYLSASCDSIYGSKAKHIQLSNLNSWRNLISQNNAADIFHGGGDYSIYQINNNDNNHNDHNNSCDKHIRNNNQNHVLENYNVSAHGENRHSDDHKTVPTAAIKLQKKIGIKHILRQRSR